AVSASNEMVGRIAAVAGRTMDIGRRHAAADGCSCDTFGVALFPLGVVGASRRRATYSPDARISGQRSGQRLEDACPIFHRLQAYRHALGLDRRLGREAIIKVGQSLLCPCLEPREF